MAYYTYEGEKYATDKNASADNVRSISPSTVGRQAFPRFSSVNEKTGTARIASPVRANRHRFVSAIVPFGTGIPTR
jgi:hypothetical protein